MKIAKKTERKSLDTPQRARCNSYSILFNLCGSPGFYHPCQNQRNRVRLFISTLRIFHVVLYKIGKKMSPWKIKKSWKSSVFHFDTNPALTLCFACCRWVVLSLNCFVPIYTAVMLTVCYINRQPGRGYHYSDTNACGESAASKKQIQNGGIVTMLLILKYGNIEFRVNLLYAFNRAFGYRPDPIISPRVSDKGRIMVECWYWGR